MTLSSHQSAAAVIAPHLSTNWTHSILDMTENADFHDSWESFQTCDSEASDVTHSIVQKGDVLKVLCVKCRLDL